MIEVARIYRFRARHSLPEMPEPWCFPHEHDYTVEVVARGDSDPRFHGVVVDTDKLDAAWGAVNRLYEKDLDRWVDVPTTVESLAREWLARLSVRVPEVYRVTVWEDEQRWGRATA